MEFKYSISEVSSKTGISSSAINYYIRSKLITPPKKTSKTRALFSEQTINELLEIKKLKSQGLPIKLIKNNLDKKENISKFDSFLGSLREFSVKYSANENWVKELIKKNLLSPQKKSKNKFYFDNLDIQLLKNFQKLIEIGIPEEYLVRHNEYIELSKAEAFFLLEHINFSNLEKDNIKSVRSHFEQVKNIIRIKELNKLLD
ncbi:MAG: MerR family transcriptional regulator [Dehalococcoidia bacterium]|tara:strand:+ start:9318 stop:9923 length:606 start_codon:yes stop_codon:yes gene_type:complete